jgi:autotransporter-associated beta strand protein
MTTKPQPRTIARILCLICPIVLSAASSQAADKLWSGGSSTYNNATSWGGAIPGAVDNAINDSGLGNAVQINVGDPDWTVGQIRADNSLGNGAYIQNGQNVTALGTNYNGPVISEFFTPFRLGVVAADTGNYTINGGALNYGNGPLNIGELGSANMIITGGAITGGGTFYVNSGGPAVPNPAVLTATAGHGPYLGDFTYYEQGYYAPDTTIGLPPAGSTITSLGSPDHSYTLAPSYHANNAVCVDTVLPSATMTLTTPTVCSALSFMCSCGNGPVTNTCVVTYASGLPDTNTIIVEDWFFPQQPQPANEILASGGRVDALGKNFQNGSTVAGYSGGAPFMWSFDIPCVNTDKVVSINLTWAGAGPGATFATATYLAVSGQTPASAGAFVPVAITGYNEDVVIESNAPSPKVSSSITDTVTQTGGSVTVNNDSVLYVGNQGKGTYTQSGGSVNVGQLFVGENGTGTYSLSSTGSMNFSDWVVIGRDGGTGTFNMTGGTMTKNNSAWITASAGNAVGTFNMSGGTFTDNGEIWLAEHAGDIGTNNISGTADLELHNWMSLGRQGFGVLNLSGNALIHHYGNGRYNISDNVGGGGTGIMNMSGSTTLQCDGDLDCGHGGGANGTLNLSAGQVNVNGWFTVGRDGSGTATFNMTGGQADAYGEFHVAEGGWNGTVNMSGGLLNTHSWMQIGRGGNAQLNLSGGTIHHFGGNGTMIIGDQAAGPQQITQTGGYIINDDQTWIGNNCSGTFTQSSGTNVMNGEFWVGQQSGSSFYIISGDAMLTCGNWLPIGRAGATGEIDMSGGSITKTGTSGDHVSVGDGGPGTINQTGGTFTSVLSDTYLGAGGTGIWNLGPGSVTLSVLKFNRDNGSSGTMNLNAGGLLKVGEINTNGATGATGIFNFNGGTLAASASDATFMQGLTTANVLVGGAVIDSGANTITIAQPLLDGDGLGGGLTKLSSGTLRLNGVNTYTGTTAVSAGTLGGTGTFAGPVTVASGATLAPGASIGTMTINNTLNLAAGSTTVMEVNKTALTSDLVTGASAITYGGTLVLKNLSGTLAVGNTFTLFSAGSYSGSFSSVVSQTPNQIVTWNLSQLAPGGNGTVTVASVTPSPVTLSPTVTGGMLHFTWPANQIGWQLQQQINPLSVGLYTNWVPVAGSTTTNAVNVPVNSNQPTVFYRLAFPAQ